MKICSIASGSSGNCLYFGTEKHHILIDAGISRKRIVEGLEKIHVNPEEIEAIFVTHEHSDHVQGIPMMEKMFQTPVYATGGTLDAILAKDKKGIISKKQLYEVQADCSVQMGDLKVTPYHMSHDAADPVCYTIEAEGHKVGIATDLGCFDEYTVEHLKDSDILFLEANHDISMLETGKYPYPLKRRILGKQGHLSNEDTGRLLCELANDRLKYAVLSHLSKENNYPELAYEAVKCQIWEELGVTKLPFHMEVAKRDNPSCLLSL